MLGAFLNIRLKQFWRLRAELGWPRTLIVLLIISYILYALMQSMASVSNSGLLLAAWTTVLFLHHSTRKDLNFLGGIGYKVRRIVLVEYILYSMPLLLMFLLAGQYYFIPANILLLAIVTISGFRLSRKYTRSLLVRIVGKKAYDIRSGVRKNEAAIIAILFLMAVLCFTVFSYPLFLIVLALILASFNIQTESRMMLELQVKNAGVFLVKKIREQCRWLFYISSPFLVIFLIINYEYWYIALVAWLIAGGLISFAVIIRYAFFEEAQVLTFNELLLLLALVFLMLPIFLPIYIFWMIRYYDRAITNINSAIGA